MNKRTYIPSKPRNKNLTIVGSGGGGIGKTEFSQVAGSSHDHVNKSVLDQITEALLTGALRDLITSTDTTSILTDDNYLSSLRVLAEITANNTNITNELKTLFLSKLGADAAQGLITFLEGIISKKIAVLEKGWKTKDFVGGLTGVGASVDSDGKGELDALTLRKWLEVPELRYNRTDITIGDTWNAHGAGVIKSVDTINKTFTLKLEEGEIGTFRYDDICMGIYHSSILEDNATSDYDDSIGNRRFAGFSTCYFRVTQVLGSYNEIVRYELRPQSTNFPKSVHPFQFMTAVAYGNFTNADRQTSNYQTKTYTRYLRNVRDWEFSLSNIAAQFGNLSNLNIFGLEMSGYSIYLNNVYFTGIIHQLSEQIQEELSKQKVGGKNLLRESDFRFDFKYWGGTGEYIDVDITTLRNAPKLSVSPTTISWVYPEFESDLNVTSNTNWNIE